MGNSVRCLDHFLTLVARSLKVLHICNTLDARLNGNDNPDSGNLSRRRATTHDHLSQWESRGQGVNPNHLLKMANFSMKTLRLMAVSLICFP